MDSVRLIAERIRKAEEKRSLIEPIAEEINWSLETAYEVQEANVAAWIKAGRRQVGWKIGLTSEAARAQMKATEPMFGALFADMKIEAGSAIPVRELIGPRLEPEIAIVMKHDLTAPALSKSEVLRAIDYALPAFEIVDCRSRDWKIAGIDAIADNALASGFVLGCRQWLMPDYDLANIEVAVAVNGVHSDTGLGANCMGHPVTALHWLARKLLDRGRHLSRGDLILTGSLCPMIKISSGDTVSAQFGQNHQLTVQVR